MFQIDLATKRPMTFAARSKCTLQVEMPTDAATKPTVVDQL